MARNYSIQQQEIFFKMCIADMEGVIWLRALYIAVLLSANMVGMRVRARDHGQPLICICWAQLHRHQQVTWTAPVSPHALVPAALYFSISMASCAACLGIMCTVNWLYVIIIKYIVVITKKQTGKFSLNPRRGLSHEHKLTKSPCTYCR